MERYRSDTEEDEQEKPLLHRGNEDTAQRGERQSFESLTRKAPFQVPYVSTYSRIDLFSRFLKHPFAFIRRVNINNGTRSRSINQIICIKLFLLT